MYDSPGDFRMAFRSWNVPGSEYNAIGFRTILHLRKDSRL